MASSVSLRALLPFLRPYRTRLVLAGVFLVLSAASSLALPGLLRLLIDRGLVAAEPEARMMALREHLVLLFLGGLAMAVFASLRLYMVSWLAERVSADLRVAVYAHVLDQSPEFFETTQTGEVLSRLTADTTLVQTVLGTSLSMGLRNGLIALGATIMLIVSNASIMLPALAILLAVVLPSTYIGRRLRKLSRSSQDRLAESSALASEVLNAVQVVQSHVQEAREVERFRSANERALQVATRRARVRSFMMTFILASTFAGLLWAFYRGTGAVLRGEATAGQLSQTFIYALMLLSGIGVLGEVWSDLLRAAGASERLAAAERALEGAPRRRQRELGGVGLARGISRGHLLLSLAARAGSARGLLARDRARRDGRPGRRERRRQEHHAATPLALLRRRRRAHRARPGRRAFALVRGAARTDRGGAAGERDLRGQRGRQHPLREAGRQRRRGDRGRTARLCARLHLGVAGRLPELPRRARCAAVGRAAPAPEHRARPLARPAAVAARRGHQRARRRERARHPERARAGDAGAHDAGDRAPAGHGAARGSHRGDGARAHRRRWYARGADRARRPVCAPRGAPICRLRATTMQRNALRRCYTPSLQTCYLTPAHSDLGEVRSRESSCFAELATRQFDPGADGFCTFRAAANVHVTRAHDLMLYCSTRKAPADPLGLRESTLKLAVFTP